MMNRKKISTGLLMLSCLVFASCSDDQAQTPSTDTTKEVVERSSLGQDTLVANVRDTAREINAKELDKTEGLLKIKETFDQFSGDWWSGSQGGQSPSLTLDELATIIGNIYGTPVENISVILLGAGEDINGMNREEQIGQLFEVLLNQRPGQLSLSQDVLLASFLNDQLFKINSASSDGADVEAAAQYYKEKVNFYLDSEGNAKEVFQKLSSIEKIFEQDRDLFYIFKGLLPEIELEKNEGYSSQNAYRRVMKGVASSQENFSRDALEKMFESSQNVTLSAIESFKQNRDIKRVQGFLDTFFSLFDRPFLPGNFEKEDWIEMIDERTEIVARDFVKMLEEEDTSRLREYPPQHPYTRLLVNRALVFRSNRLWLDQNEFEKVDNYMKSFFQRISELHGEDIDFERYQQDELKKYLMDYYHVEIYRSFLEYQSSKKGSVFRLKDSRNETYDNLVKSLLSALSYRYDNEVTFEEFRSSGRGVKLYDELNAEFMDRSDHTFGRNYCSDQSEDCELVLKAGIYTAPADTNLQLYGKSLRFTPLAMIYSPGQDIYLNFESIEGLWVDASGLNGKDAFRMSEEENNTTYPRHRTRKSGEYTYYELSQEPISPKQQASGDEGLDAGYIQLHQPYRGEISGIPLLVSRGGNGGDGAKGFDAIEQGTNECQETFTFDIGNIRRYTEVYYQEECRIGAGGMNVTCNPVKKTRKKVDRSLTKRNYTLNRGQGGDGGNGGHSSRPVIKGGMLDQYISRVSNFIMTPGNPGNPGAAGDCGAGEASEFQGAARQAGMILED